MKQDKDRNTIRVTRRTPGEPGGEKPQVKAPVFVIVLRKCIKFSVLREEKVSYKTP